MPIQANLPATSAGSAPNSPVAPTALSKKPGRSKRGRHAAAMTLLVLGGLSAAAQEIPLARFTDITSQAGIHFIHENGAYGDKLLPETMGGGVAFFDYDNDGNQDLLLVNSTYWP